MSQGQSEEKRRTKAAQVIHAIYDLDELVDNLYKLRDEIANTEMGSPDEAPAPSGTKGTPSLAELLDCGADWISERNAKAHNLVNEIRSMLI